MDYTRLVTRNKLGFRTVAVSQFALSNQVMSDFIRATTAIFFLAPRASSLTTDVMDD
jgi:hypothetical protein